MNLQTRNALSCKITVVVLGGGSESAAYIWNRSPTTALKDKTPNERWFGKKPDLSNIRVFGCISYVHVPAELRKKLDPKAQKCIFIGYPDGTKGFKLYNLEAKKFIRSRSVLFCEDKFNDFDSKLDENDYISFFLSLEPQEIHESEKSEINSEIIHSHAENDDQSTSESEDEEDESLSYEERFLNEVQNIGRVRTRREPERFEAANIVTDCCFVTSLISDADEPNSFQDAMSDPNWLQAMESEISSLNNNNTWELVPRPSGKNVVKSKS